MTEGETSLGGIRGCGAEQHGARLACRSRRPEGFSQTLEGRRRRSPTNERPARSRTADDGSGTATGVKRSVKRSTPEGCTFSSPSGTSIAKLAPIWPSPTTAPLQRSVSTSCTRVGNATEVGVGSRSGVSKSSPSDAPEPTKLDPTPNPSSTRNPASKKPVLFTTPKPKGATWYSVVPPEVSRLDSRSAGPSPPELKKML